MANRHLSRSIVLQTLFEWDFNGAKNNEIKESLERNLREFGPGLEDDAFVIALTEQILEKRSVIDEIIQKAAPEWPIDKISIIDRNILRIGLTELLFGDRTQVPPKVAINESIELAKTFGGENSSKFINGVLGAVYKEIGEPGKDDISKKKKVNEPVDKTTLPVERKAGAIVYCLKDGQIQMAFVHDVFGYWTLSKGGVEEGETNEEATIRELKEEIGLDIEVVAKLGENEYVASHPVDGKILKKVIYFLAKSEYRELILESSGGLDGARWFTLAEIPELKIYNDIVPLITKAVEIISAEK
ncbi:MAG: transcription antitermination factor NusB [Candidatus Nomurabacteria bacterium]|nr:transcription antitermination factor NusB [Candidatus Nomurabacteria bacterium]